MTDTLKNKLKDLDKKINDIKESQKPKEVSSTNSGIKYVTLITVELLVGLAVGGFIGHHIDNFFTTKPLFFIVFMILGLAGGFLNLLRNLR